MCPTNETSAVFVDCFSILMDRIQLGRFEGINGIFERPSNVNIIIGKELSIQETIDECIKEIAWLKKKLDLAQLLR